MFDSSWIQWNPNFSNLQGKCKLVQDIGEFEKLGVKLQCLTEERERFLVKVIGRFEKTRVQEIGITLYLQLPTILVAGKPTPVPLCL